MSFKAQAPANRHRHPAFSVFHTLSACAAESLLGSCAMSASREWEDYGQRAFNLGHFLHSSAMFTSFHPLHFVLKLRSVHAVSYRLWSGQPSQKGGIPSSFRFFHDMAWILASFTVESLPPFYC